MEIISFDLNSELLSDFIGLQDKYFSEELFVPTPKEHLLAVLNDMNPFFSLSKYKFFLIKEDNQFIARAMAAIDSRRVQKEDEIIGNIGYFECPNNQDIANKILECCSSWLKENGATHIHGPMDLHIYNNYRFMTEGFDKTPFAVCVCAFSYS